jgi:hypothetical protein
MKPDAIIEILSQRATAIRSLEAEGEALVGPRSSSPRFAAVLAGVFVLTSRLQAQFDYPNFTGTDNLNILGVARAVGGYIRLTPADVFQNGSVVHATQQLLGDGFEVTFTFRISGIDPIYLGADGLAFIIRNQGPTAQGPQVGYIPYNIPDRLAVEFDTWKNDTDPDDNHISLQPVGPAPVNSEFFHDLSLGSASSIPNMSDGKIRTARFTYQPGTMGVYLDDPAIPALTASINLGNVNGSSVVDDQGNAWVGLAAGTGAGY